MHLAYTRCLARDVISLVLRHTKQSDSKATYLLVVIVGSGVGSGFERFDLGGDILETLVAGEPGGLVFLCFGHPVLCLLCRLECRVFPDGGISVSVDLLDVGRSDVISEVG